MTFYEEMIAKIAEERRKQEEREKEEETRQRALDESTIAYAKEIMQKFLDNVSLCFSDSNNLNDEVFSLDLVGGNPRMIIQFKPWISGREKPLLNEILLKEIFEANNIDFYSVERSGVTEGERFYLVFNPEKNKRQVLQRTHSNMNITKK